MNTSTETKLYLGYTGLQVLKQAFVLDFYLNHTYVAHRKTYHMNWKKNIYSFFKIITR